MLSGDVDDDRRQLEVDGQRCCFFFSSRRRHTRSDRDWSSDVCSSDLDVYCEKPMTHAVSEGFEMIAAEQKHNRIVQIGSQRRSSIVYAKAKELYEKGAIGEVCLVEAGMGRNDPCGAWQYTVPPTIPRRP